MSGAWLPHSETPEQIRPPSCRSAADSWALVGPGSGVALACCFVSHDYATTAVAGHHLYRLADSALLAELLFGR